MGTINMIDEIRPYSVKDLAGIYGVCDKTLKKWVDSTNKKYISLY